MTSDALTNVDRDLARFSLADGAIARMAEEYLALKVEGLDDREGLKAVHTARMVVKGHRVQVEKVRKELKADALEYGRRVDGEAKRITALLEPIETHLQEQEEWVEQERARIKREAEEAARAKLDERMRGLQEAGAPLPVSAVQAMSDEEYQGALEQAQEAQRVRLEAERLAAEEKARQTAQELQQRKLEGARLKAEREALAAERAQLEEEARKVREAQEAQRRSQEIAQARQEAAERARQEAEAEAKAKAEREARAAQEAERARLAEEARRPAREQVLALALQVEALPVPACPWVAEIHEALRLCAGHIRELAREPAEADPLPAFTSDDSPW